MKEITTKKLMDTIVEGIRNRKGQRIVTIDLRKIKEAPVEMMIICEGQSNTQVAAIADEIDDFVRTTTHVHPLSVSGQENAECAAVDTSVAVAAHKEVVVLQQFVIFGENAEQIPGCVLDRKSVV